MCVCGGGDGVQFAGTISCRVSSSSIWYSKATPRKNRKEEKRKEQEGKRKKRKREGWGRWNLLLELILELGGSGSAVGGLRLLAPASTCALSVLLRVACAW